LFHENGQEKAGTPTSSEGKGKREKGRDRRVLGVGRWVLGKAREGEVGALLAAPKIVPQGRFLTPNT
jgi:hypothetical protein